MHKLLGEGGTVSATPTMKAKAKVIVITAALNQSMRVRFD